MKLTITIEMDNSAFRDADTDEPAHGTEVANILRQIADSVDAVSDLSELHQRLYDTNGNRVGVATVSQ